MEPQDRDSAHVSEWLESRIGGRVVSIERQPRWRPVWFADVERNGQRLALCVRGDRTDAQIGFTLEHGRTQRVFINSGTMTYGQFEVRCVWSPAHRMTDPASPELANRLLQDNLKKKLGAWEIDAQPDGSFLICFSAKIPASLDPEALADVIDIVLVTSDKLEEELGAADEY